jgi:hypothetical protein
VCGALVIRGALVPSVAMSLPSDFVRSDTSKNSADVFLYFSLHV